MKTVGEMEADFFSRTLLPYKGYLKLVFHGGLSLDFEAGAWICCEGGIRGNKDGRTYSIPWSALSGVETIEEDEDDEG